MFFKYTSKEKRFDLKPEFITLLTSMPGKYLWLIRINVENLVSG